MLFLFSPLRQSSSFQNSSEIMLWKNRFSSKLLNISSALEELELWLFRISMKFSCSEFNPRFLASPLNTISSLKAFTEWESWLLSSLIPLFPLDEDLVILDEEWPLESLLESFSKLFQLASISESLKLSLWQLNSYQDRSRNPSEFVWDFSNLFVSFKYSMASTWRSPSLGQSSSVCSQISIR